MNNRSDLFLLGELVVVVIGLLQEKTAVFGFSLSLGVGRRSSTATDAVLGHVGENQVDPIEVVRPSVRGSTLASTPVGGGKVLHGLARGG